MKAPERQTKIIATIGPATESEEMLAALIGEGVDVMRLNMAHATHDWIREITQRIRKVGQELNREPAILMDVKGPEIRTGYLQNPVDLTRGDLIDLVFTAQPEPPRSDDVWQIEVNYDRLHEHLSNGNNVLLDNGLIPLLVVETSPKHVRCRVLQNAQLKAGDMSTCPASKPDFPRSPKKIVSILWWGSNASTISLPFRSPAMPMRSICLKVFSRITKAPLRLLPKLKTSRG